MTSKISYSWALRLSFEVVFFIPDYVCCIMTAGEKWLVRIAKKYLHLQTINCNKNHTKRYISRTSAGVLPCKLSRWILAHREIFQHHLSFTFWYRSIFCIFELRGSKIEGFPIGKAIVLTILPYATTMTCDSLIHNTWRNVYEFCSRSNLMWINWSCRMRWKLPSLLEAFWRLLSNCRGFQNKSSQRNLIYAHYMKVILCKSTWFSAL